MLSWANSAWIMGCVISISAALISTLGFTMQKLSHIETIYEDPITQKIPRITTNKEESCLSRPKWVFGLSLMIFASILDFAALAFAAQSLVGTLASFSLVFNILISESYLGEKVTQTDWYATAFIVCGSVIAVAWGQHESRTYTLDSLMQLYNTSNFIIYAIVILKIMITLYCSIYYIEKTYRIQTSTAEYKYSYSPSIAKIHRVLYPCLAGITGAQSVLFLKSFAELVKATMFEEHTQSLFTHVGTYAIVFFLVSTVLLQVTWLNAGLARFDNMSVVPIFQSFWIFVTAIGGFVFYNELKDFTAFQSFMFLIGIILTLIGIYLLSSKATQRASEVEDLESNKCNSSLLSEETPLLLQPTETYDTNKEN